MFFRQTPGGFSLPDLQQTRVSNVPGVFFSFFCVEPALAMFPVSLFLLCAFSHSSFTLVFHL